MSKLNVDQKNICALLGDKKSVLLFLIIKDPMRGLKKNVKHYGKIYLSFLFQKESIINLIMMKNII